MDIGRVGEAVSCAFVFLIVSLGIVVGLASIILGPVGINTHMLPFDLEDYHMWMFVGGGWFLILWVAASVSLYRYPRKHQE
ncbi:MAG: hypothetical protein A2719_01795 [Candidatus Ryanbacteria bacterium RIFCSPHIGHO2_01_FULL_45_22]|uniref:Uncharacterized protein n=2 Tax=Candidatus Ryaniibacteriota TaxID=1817914 RepID=A0A1G2FYD5_9BACT|nr:MAG: hypothetical protein A2719_01795 [Candidatus Ryanbacteria bacterium RIFCSPHIGHO2_01_FULL_45_22]OGZ45356.1 MAG: hypothetical protein A3J54_03885 [Candidatus Ryanbacteria bacterium RIFCSPHIGHO2_02_FULL_45_13b]